MDTAPMDYMFLIFPVKITNLQEYIKFHNHLTLTWLNKEGQIPHRNKTEYRKQRRWDSLAHSNIHIQPNFLILIFFSIFLMLLPFAPLDILLSSLNIRGKRILLPVSHVIFLDAALLCPSFLQNLIFFPNRLDNSPLSPPSFTYVHPHPHPPSGE